MVIEGHDMYVMGIGYSDFLEKKNASLPSWEKGATVSENFLISLDH